jgi:hypothetical protein
LHKFGGGALRNSCEVIKLKLVVYHWTWPVDHHPFAEPGVFDFGFFDMHPHPSLRPCEPHGLLAVHEIEIVIFIFHETVIAVQEVVEPAVKKLQVRRLLSRHP